MQLIQRHSKLKLLAKDTPYRSEVNVYQYQAYCKNWLLQAKRETGDSQFHQELLRFQD